ncbi:GAF domain-containing protein [Williamsia muralis]|uniref:GAF domain-containing sensor histidine kinase n=1 Tax=Williamsia marianensis TaxID=85044 RepID=UPI003F14E6DB
MKPSIEPPPTGHQFLRGAISRLRVNRLSEAAHEQIDEISEVRIHDLIEAVLLVTADLDLGATLRSIVRSAMKLADAHYGALGVWGAGESFDGFIHEGIDEKRVAEIGALPTGRGVLGKVAGADVLRLHDLSRHPDSCGFPAHHPPMSTFLGTQIRVGDDVFGTLYLTEKRGGRDFTEDDEAIIRTLAAAAAIAIDHARAHEEARSRLAWIESIRDIRAELMAGTEMTSVLSMIARGLFSLTDADAVLIAQPMDAEDPRDTIGELIITATEGNARSGLLGRAIDVRHVAPGLGYATLKPALRDNLGIPALAGESGVDGPAMVVPLDTGESIYGIFLVARGHGKRPFTHEMLNLSSEFAVQVALGMSMAAAVQRSRTLEVLADRERIARVLHDHVIQRIFAAGMNLQGTLQRTHSPPVQRRLTETVNDLQDIIQEIRTTIFDLQPDGRESTRLRQRIHEVIDQQTRDFSGRTFVRMSGPLSVVAPGLAEHAVAVVREGVTNAVHYAEPETITVIVSVEDDLVIEIVDDGVGVGDDVTPSGLTNLRNRARELGGDLTFTTTSNGSGVALKWWAPLDQ